MNHFSSSNWIDLTRGVLPAHTASVMQDHLNKGCEQCTAAFDAWRVLLEVVDETKGDGAENAPTGVLHGKLDLQSLSQVLSIARPVFDTFVNAPQPLVRSASSPMVRSSPQFSRQMVHEAEPFVIDVRLEYGFSRHQINLVGQVLNAQNPGSPMQTVDVILLSEENLVKRTRANSAGEFVIEFAPEPNLQLLINIRGHRAIGLVLPDLMG